MIYTNKAIIDNFEDNLMKARNCLQGLDFCDDRNGANFKGLTGWVFEETILKCIRDELNDYGLSYKINSQFKLSTLKVEGKKCRGQADLEVNVNSNTYLIELKNSGLFSASDREKYSKYKKIIEDNNYKYLYLTKEESYLNYRNLCKEVFGVDKAFFLDREEDWKRFIEILIS